MSQVARCGVARDTVRDRRFLCLARIHHDIQAQDGDFTLLPTGLRALNKRQRPAREHQEASSPSRDCDCRIAR
eukprot:gene6826-biopygen13862